MCHTSGASYLAWATLSTGLLVFLFYHLWSFDKFKCLRWDSGAYSGAFKRIMTYSYLLSVPLIWTYSVGFTIIKYRAGFIFFPGPGGSLTIFPTPYTAWDDISQAALFPLTFLFSVAWGLEMVTHLEELCFWYFLLNSGAEQRDWFRTWHFRFWVIGSTIAVILMPLLAVLTRADPLKSEPYIFITGSLGSLSITVWFLPILWMFPTFLDSLKHEGVDTATLVRLTKFNELNRARVFLRFLFVLPLLILGIDGLRPGHVLNESMTITDVLVTISAFGCLLSSAMTLVIFFPRSVEGEIAERDAARSRKWATSNQELSRNDSHDWGQSRISEESYVAPMYAPDVAGAYPFAQPTTKCDDDTIRCPNKSYSNKEYESQQRPKRDLPPLRPNRRNENGVELGNLPSRNTSRSQSRARYSVNPMIHNWKSPLEFGQEPNHRFTFQRPV